MRTTSEITLWKVKPCPGCGIHGWDSLSFLSPINAVLFVNPPALPAKPVLVRLRELTRDVAPGSVLVIGPSEERELELDAAQLGIASEVVVHGLRAALPKVYGVPVEWGDTTFVRPPARGG